MQRPFLISAGLAVTSVIATGIAWRIGFQRWWAFLILPAIFVSMFINSWVLQLEDDLPGGFDNTDGQHTPGYVAKVGKIGRVISITLIVVCFSCVLAAIGYYFLKNQ